MKYIQVKEKKYSMEHSQRGVKTELGTMWLPVYPELLDPNLKERFIHSVLKKHFSYGQSFCVVCGKEDVNYKVPIQHHETIT